MKDKEFFKINKEKVYEFLNVLNVVPILIFSIVVMLLICFATSHTDVNNIMQLNKLYVFCVISLVFVSIFMLYEVYSINNTLEKGLKLLENKSGTGRNNKTKRV